MMKTGLDQMQQNAIERLTLHINYFHLGFINRVVIGGDGFGCKKYTNINATKKRNV